MDALRIHFAEDITIGVYLDKGSELAHNHYRDNNCFNNKWKMNVTDMHAHSLSPMTDIVLYAHANHVCVIDYSQSLGAAS